MCFQPWLVVFGEGVEDWLSTCLAHLEMLPFPQEGLGPSKACGPSRKDTAHFLGGGVLVPTFFFSMLRMSRGKVLPEQMEPSQKAFPPHCPLQPHLSPISLAYPLPTLTYALLLLSIFPPKPLS